MDKFPQHRNVIELLEFKGRFGDESPSRRPSSPPVPAELPDLKAATGNFLEDIMIAWQERFAATTDFLANRSKAGKLLTEEEMMAFANVYAEMEQGFQKLKDLWPTIEQVNASLDHFEKFKPQEKSPS